jgi:hypothetical protein
MNSSRNWTVGALLALVVAILAAIFAFTGFGGYVYTARYLFWIATVMFVVLAGGSALLRGRM